MKDARIGWVSTRSPSGRPVDFTEAMLRGLAPDGGLYVPTEIPTIVHGVISEFPDHAVESVLPWIDSDTDTADAVRSALTFPVPVVEPRPGVFVVELFHGPTLSFKDFGARTMARLMDRVLRDRTGRRTVFVATSGDTGSAVADGFAGMDGIRVVLLYPEGQVSPVQERQLAAPRRGVLAIRVRGSFDDCQRMVKAVFEDPRFDRLGPTSANSINVGRLVPQTTYHAWAAALVPNALVVVPSGNLGNLTAAVMARQAGAPVGGLVAAHNANRAFPDYLEGGAPPATESRRTLSNAMDVGAPSNFERLEALLGAEGLRGSVRGFTVSDGETIESIRRTFETSGYLCDPHTAVGMEAIRQIETEGHDGPFVLMSTAHPAKFPETVERAIGQRPREPEALAALPVQDRWVPSVDATREALFGILEERGFTG